MEKYLNNFEDGDFEAPSPDVIRKWFADFQLNSKKFSAIIGIKERNVPKYISSIDHPRHLDLTFSETQVFLIWAGLVKPKFRNEIDFPISDDFFVKFKFELISLNMDLSDFCDEFLDFDSKKFYYLKRFQPEKLESIVRVHLRDDF